MLKHLVSLLLFCALLPALSALDLMTLEKWIPGGNVKVTSFKERSGEPVIRIEIPKTEKKITYAAVDCVFPEAVDLSKFNQLEMTVKTSQKIKVFLRINTRGGGNLFPGWSRQNTDSLPKQFVFTRKEMKNDKNPDLKKALSITFGFGLWQYDTTKFPLEIEVRKAKVIDPAERFLIPRPTAGTMIDGAYKKDWGYENVLYLWTPPEFIHLSGKEFSVGKTIPTAEDLSGNFSFMADASNLYFLALVADRTPGEGTNPVAPWKNDSVELFLASGIRQKDLETQKPLHGHGFQIIFDISAGGKPLLLKDGTKITDSGIRFKTLKENVNVNGKPVPGYVLEAAIPRKLLPGKPERGSLIAYCINLNDSRSGASLRTNPASLRPATNIFGYRKAFLEYQGRETLPVFQFGAVAPDLPWPEIYHADGKRIWDDSLLTRSKTPSTQRIYLNGFWAVQGSKDETASPDPAKWFYAPLPMSIGWHTPVYRIHPQKKNSLQPSSYSLVTDKAKNTFFWYERTFMVPAEWKGKHVRLTFDHVEKEVTVCINGKSAGRASLMTQSVDLSNVLEYGKKNRIDLHLFGKLPHGPSLRREDGILGDLYLEVSDHAPVIEDIWVRKADGTDGKFQIQVTAPALGNGKITLELLSPEGNSLFRAEKKIENESNIIFKGQCLSFPQWSIEHPRLCTARIRAEKADGTLIQEKTQRFGFRTFETKNGHFLLNGRIVRLRTAFPKTPSQIYDPGRMEYLRKLGFNAIYLHAVEGGYNTPLYELCDKFGFLVMAPVEQTYSDDQTIEAIRKIRNHPSIIGYLSDPYGQLTSNGFNLNPFETDDSYMPSSRAAKDQEAFMEKRDALFKKADPERGYIAQATGNWKNFMRMLHHYPTNGLNLLDRMMYYTPWANRPEKKLPLYLLEAGTINLYNMDTQHPEHQFPVMKERRMVPRLLFYEAASRYLGDAAFENWLEWSRIFFLAGLRGFRLNGVDGFCAWTDELYAHPFNTDRAEGIKDNRKLSWHYFTEPLLGTENHEWMRTNSWYFKLRALAYYPWPEEFGQGNGPVKKSIFAPLYENEMQPLYLTLTGEKNDLFTRDHNFYGGETVRKQVAVVNDTEEPVTVNGTVALRIGGKTTASFPFRKTVAQGAIDFIPFEFRLPAVNIKTKAELLLEAEGRKESFALTLFPKPDRKALTDAAKKVSIGIAKGKGGSVAGKAGLKGIQVDLAKGVPKGIDVLIVERGALVRNTDAKSLSGFLRNGGLILIFEQDDTSLYSHRVNEQRLEHAFLADTKHGAVKGLSSEDLSFWRGRAESVVNEKQPSEAFRHNQSVALETPHLTNRNLVAGFALENPSYGSIRPIVTGGYDRNYAVVLEARSGKGTILFCQADVSPRYGTDPAATLLADNLLETVLQKQEPQIPGVRYTGDEAGKQFLARLGIRIVKDSPICVAGRGTISRELLKQSRTIVRLPGSDYLPESVTLRRQYLTKETYPHFWNGGFFQFQMMKGTLPGTDFPEEAGNSFRGLSASDFYLFENPQTESFDFKLRNGDTRSPHGSMAEVIRNGTRNILCALDPDSVKHGEERRKIYRVWSVLFHNLNVENQAKISFERPVTDLTDNSWTFLTDPDGKGEQNGFADGKFGSRSPRPIKTGMIWEDQGVTEKNPYLESDPYSAYDGYGWYFTELELDHVPAGPIYLHVNGIRDIATFKRTEHQTTLFLNGKKMPDAIGIYNAYLGGRGARLWKLDARSVLKKGKNRIAIRIYNGSGAGGIHRNPVRFEFEGKNSDLLFPYEFNESKYTNDFFWCW